MKTIKHYALSALSLLLFPAITFAQSGGGGTGGNLTTLDNLVSSLSSIVSTAIPVAAGLAMVGFFFGLAKYIFQAGNDEAQEEGKEIMIWGVIALFLIAAIGGIIEAIEATLGLGGEDFDATNFGDSL